MTSPVSNHSAAVACALSAMAVFGLIDNLMRIGTATGGLWQFHLLRSVLALLLLWAAAMAWGIALWPKRPRWVGLRSIMTTTAMVIYFGCLGVLPIEQAVAGLFTAPLFTVLITMVVLREPIGARRIAAVLLGFLGILLVLRPDAQGSGAATVFPLLAGATYAVGNIITRRECAQEETLSLLAGFFGCMMCVGAVGLLMVGVFVTEAPAGADGFLYRGWVTPQGGFLWLILIQGIGSAIGVGLSIRAYQLADPSTIAVFENAMILFATIWAFVLWGEVPGAVTLLGLACIVAAGIVISVRSRALAVP